MKDRFKVIAVAIVLAAISACASDTDEGTETSAEAQSACKPTGTVGSDAWRASLKACVDGASKGSGGAAGKDGTAKKETGGGTCTLSIRCNGNEPCKCGSGPNAGQTCDGSASAGAASCSQKCRHCE